MTTDTTTAPDAWASKIQRLRDRKPREEWVTFHDEEALAAVGQARLEVTQARRKARDAEHDPIDDHPDVVAAQGRLDAAEEAAAEAEVVWHFRALPPEVYDAMQHQHPATPEQEERGQVYDPATFFPALIAACSVNPITAGQVAELIDGWTDDDGVKHPAVLNQGEVGSLVNACRQVNETPRMSLGKGSRSTGG